MNVTDWYWIIGGSTTDVWSSRLAKSVPVGDAGYVAWLSVPRNVPTPIPTMAALQQYFSVSYPQGTLQTYNAFVRYNIASGGVTIAGKPYMTEPVARNTLGSAHDYAVANPGHITDWKLADGTFIQLDEPGLAHALQQMATFVQSCFTCESANLTALTNGTMTTLAEIDAAFAAISKVYP